MVDQHRAKRPLAAKAATVRPERRDVLPKPSGASRLRYMETRDARARRLFDALGFLRAAWPGGGWSWDNRLTCAASSFNIELAGEARAAADLALRHEWTRRTLASAPPLVREIAEQSGGVRDDQYLLASDPVDRVIAFGLWWPWGDEQTISLRVGLAGHRVDPLRDQLRDLFGATF